jgi:hypothetical protein
MQFWGVLINNHFTEPNFMDLYFTVYALVNSEDTPDKEYKKKLEFIEQNTTQKLGMQLAQVEYFYWKNCMKGLQTDLTLKGDKSLNIMQVFAELNEALKEMVMIVVKLGKKYSLDIKYKMPETEGKGDDFKL